MQRPRQTDLGISVLNALYEHLGVERKWTRWIKRGFVWWPSGLAQSAWAERGVVREGHVVFRMHVRTDLFDDSAGGNVAGAMLNDWGRRAMLSALVRDPANPRRLQLAACVRAHAGNLAWVLPLLCCAAAMQIAEAADLAAQVGLLGAAAGLRPLFSGHPSAGMRLDPAAVPPGSAQRAASGSGDGNEFAGPEMERMGALLDSAPWVQVCSDSEGVTAELPIAGRTAMLQMRVSRDGWAGNGMRTLLHVPVENLREDSARELLEWNGGELDGPGQGQCIGSWSACGPGMAHTAFYPNRLFRPGCIANIGLDAMERARRVSEGRMGARWDGVQGQVVDGDVAGVEGRLGGKGS